MINKKILTDRYFYRHDISCILFKRTIFAAIIFPISSLSLYAENEGDRLIVDNEVKALPTIMLNATPLNKSNVVNAGAFGVKDLLDIPIQIKSYDEKIISDQKSRTLFDVIYTDVSISGASYGGGFDNFRLRGFAMDNFNTIRRDGLTLSAHHDLALENIERIDVLKGPSGFLYGFNSPGGTINYILKRPTKDPFTTLTLQGSTQRNGYVALDNSNATDDGHFSYRFNTAYEKKGDFNHAGDLERYLIGLATDFRLTDDALLQLNFDWTKKIVTADPLLRADQHTRTNPLDRSSYILPPRVDPRNLLSPSWYRHETEGINVDGKLQIELNDQWESITQANYSRAERHGGYNDLYDIQPNGDIARAGFYQSRGEVFSATSFQSYLSGKFDTGIIGHDVFIGGAYKRLGDRSPFWDLIESGGDIGVWQVSVGNILNPVQPPKYYFGPKKDIDYKGIMAETSVFVSDLISLNDYWQVLLGGRYIWYKSKYLSATTLPHNESTFVPAASLIFRPIENMMSYISYSKGFERGENAPWDANNANQPTGTIVSKQYEVGMKAELTQKLNMGLAIFDIKRDANYRDINNDYVKEGQYRHRGAELEFTGLLTENLSLLSSVAYLDTELKKVIDLSTLGKRSQGTPKWKAYAGFNYKIPYVTGLSIDSGINYTGSRAVDSQNSGFIPSFTLVDAGLKYSTHFEKMPVIVRLLGKNLFNKYYYSSVFDGGVAIGQPREVLLSVQSQF